MKILQTLECTYGVHERAWEILKYLLKRRGSPILYFHLFPFYIINLSFTEVHLGMYSTTIYVHIKKKYNTSCNYLSFTM